MSDNDQMKLFVDNLWRYFEPKIEEKMRSSIRYYRAEVTANPGGNRLTVQRPFDTPVTIPCVDCMSDAKAGDQVLVMVFGGSANGSNSVVVGDGTLHAFGGVNSPLSISNGGTGERSGADAANALINALSTGSAAPVDADYYVSQYSGGGTTTTTYHRRPMSALWSYIKGKIGLDSNGILPVSKGGTGASTAAEAVQNLFASGSSVASYPTNPGIFRTTGTNIFQNMTPYSNYGVLVIFKVTYAAHFYVDSYGNLYYGYSGGSFAEPSKWYTPTAEQKT